MGFGSVAGVTLAVAAVIVLAVMLMSYVSSLVKNAYQIKIELRSDVDNAIAAMNAEIARSSKLLRKELGDDAGKVRDNIAQDAERRLAEIEQRLIKSIADQTQADRSARQDTQARIEDLARRIRTLERDVAALKEDSLRRAAISRSLRDRQAATDAPPPPVEAPAADPAPEAGLLAAMTDMTEPAPAPAPVPAPKPAPAPAPAAEDGAYTSQRYTYTDFKG